jgi:hypothetical protein
VQSAESTRRKHALPIHHAAFRFRSTNRDDWAARATYAYLGLVANTFTLAANSFTSWLARTADRPA